MVLRSCSKNRMASKHNIGLAIDAKNQAQIVTAARVMESAKTGSGGAQDRINQPPTKILTSASRIRTQPDLVNARIMTGSQSNF
jgi:hypothetical protein